MKMQYSFTMDYYAAVKNEDTKDIGKWMKLGKKNKQTS